MMDVMILQLNEFGLSGGAFVYYLLGAMYAVLSLVLMLKKELPCNKGSIDVILFFAVLGSFRQLQHLGLDIYSAHYIFTGLVFLFFTLAISLLNGGAKVFMHEIKKLKKAIKQYQIELITNKAILSDKIDGVIRIVLSIVMVMVTVLLSIVFQILLWPSNAIFYALRKLKPANTECSQVKP